MLNGSAIDRTTWNSEMGDCRLEAIAATAGRFVQPTATDEMLGELNDLASPVAAFVRECCNAGPEYEVQRKDIYQAYTGWAKNMAGSTWKTKLVSAEPYGQPYQPWVHHNIESTANQPGSMGASG